MTRYDLDPVEVRVLGSLVEKQRTTPDQYPLSLNALRLACNQSTNREPVVAYEEPEIRDALHRLGSRGWTRLASGPGSRAAKYRHLLDEALGLTPSELAVLALLMLRGPQTLGELKARSERLYRFADLDDVERTLTRLDEHELAHRLPRQPGQKEERWTHLVGETAPAVETAPVTTAPSLLEERVATLEARLAELENMLVGRGLL
jgi:uncharacterized protein YceH (UPF0502 family)